MKRVSLWAILFLWIAPLGAMNTARQSRCRFLGECLQRMGDYLLFGSVNSSVYFLASQNRVWSLAKTIERKKNIPNLDHYYAYPHKIVVNTTPVAVYYTPLHEAISRGNVEIVKLLCQAGADKYKKIKGSDITSEDLARDPGIYYVFSFTHRMKVSEADVQATVSKILEVEGVGLTAVEWAKKHADAAQCSLENAKSKDPEDIDLEFIARRLAIYEYLSKNSSEMA